MKNVIVGTAGHIDHGKTALVKALTGIDADRLEEEKRRGITIDLGFAHLQLTPEPAPRLRGRARPRALRQEHAGRRSGIDLVLFVIAADESIKPQTREHFDICRLLGIPRGIVALTKAIWWIPTFWNWSARGGRVSSRFVSGRRAHGPSAPPPAPGSTICARVGARRRRRAVSETPLDISACQSGSRFHRERVSAPW
jgi:hypothetical protein